MAKENKDIRPILRFKSDGTFKILMISDTHGCAPGRSLFDTQIKEDAARLIDAAEPDLILIAGDITGGRQGVATAAELRAFLDWFLPVIEDKCIPWAHVYGNHDNEDGLDPHSKPGVPNEQQQVIYESYPHCVSEAGPGDIHGVGNYVLPVLGSRTDEPRFLVWGLDSGQNIHNAEKEYGFSGTVLPSMAVCVFDGARPDQVQWYRSQSQRLENLYNRKIPGIMYFHIPLPEHILVLDNPEQTKMTGTYSQYTMDSKLCASSLNSGLFASVLERGDVRGIYCGHIHNSDFEGIYCGIKLGTDGALSHTNSGVNDKWRGGRLFLIKESDPDEFVTRFIRVSDC